jgi:protein-arginine kinase activator protein McsA
MADVIANPGVPRYYLDTCPECKKYPAKFITPVEEKNGRKMFRMLCESCAGKHAVK